jgi:3-oxoacyl-[acyl-carrier-protein] synthase-3
MEKVFVNVGRYGNMSAASVPLALSEAVASGRVKPGDRLLLVAFGAGLTSGAITLQWTADPAAMARAAGIGPGDVTIRSGYLEPVNPFPAALEWLRAGADAEPAIP